MKSPSISEDYRASSSRAAIERTRRADIYTHTHRSKYSAQNSCVALAFIAALECQMTARLNQVEPRLQMPMAIALAFI